MARIFISGSTDGLGRAAYVLSHAVDPGWVATKVGAASPTSVDKRVALAGPLSRSRRPRFMTVAL